MCPFGSIQTARPRRHRGMEIDQSTSHTRARQMTTSLLRRSIADPAESVIYHTQTHQVRTRPLLVWEWINVKVHFIPQERYNLEFHKRLWPDCPQTRFPYTFQNQLFLCDRLHLTSHYPAWDPWQKVKKSHHWKRSCESFQRWNGEVMCN